MATPLKITNIRSVVTREQRAIIANELARVYNSVWTIQTRQNNLNSTQGSLNSADMSAALKQGDHSLVLNNLSLTFPDCVSNRGINIY